MIDELSRIESIYGCVAEYYRCKEEEECGYYEPTEEEMEENRLSMAVYNEKIRILDGQPSDFILSLKREWEERRKKEVPENPGIYDGQRFYKKKVIDVVNRISKYQQRW